MTIKWNPEEVWTTVLNFSKMDKELARQTYNLGKDVKDWKVELAQRDLIDSGLDKKKIVPILYRPFDLRYTYYSGKSRGFHCRPRSDVMRHLIQNNIGLCVGRAGRAVGLEKPWNIVFISQNIVDLNLFYRGGELIYPLYIYPYSGRKDLFSHEEERDHLEPNINPATFCFISEIYNNKLKPEELIFYIYSVLHSNIYRAKYAEFLKMDFPRVPFTKDYKLFCRMAELGKRLVDLHLLKSPELEPPMARFQGKGGNKVEKPKHEKNRVYINKEQYFEGVRPDIWEYQIGGYRVCEKWLKDRKNRALSLEDIKHYCKVVTSLSKTSEIQKDIDKLYPRIEQSMIDFGSDKLEE